MHSLYPTAYTTYQCPERDSNPHEVALEGFYLPLPFSRPALLFVVWTFSLPCRSERLGLGSPRKVSTRSGVKAPASLGIVMPPEWQRRVPRIRRLLRAGFPARDPNLSPLCLPFHHPGILRKSIAHGENRSQTGGEEARAIASKSINSAKCLFFCCRSRFPAAEMTGVQSARTLRRRSWADHPCACQNNSRQNHHSQAVQGQEIKMQSP